MDSLNYEAIIVGGGPAGATAGFVLAKAGKRVLIVDQEEFPRDKLCGGALTEKCLRALKEIYSPFDQEEIIDSRNNRYEFYAKDKGMLNDYVSPGQTIYFVNRKPFDAYLLNKALRAGCEYKRGQVLKAENGKIFLSSGEILVAETVIGADGANSVVRRALTDKIRKGRIFMALEVEADYGDLHCFRENICPQIHFGFINHGYAWVFPKKDKVTVGLGGIAAKNKKNIRELFLVFLDSVLEDNKKKYLAQIKGFPAPSHNLLRRPAKDSLFLIGDAAGLVEPITGEGIYYAISSGAAAAKCLLKNKAASSYNQYFHKNLYRPFQMANSLKNLFFLPGLHGFFLKKIGGNRKYIKLFFELLCGGFSYGKFLRKILMTR